MVSAPRSLAMRATSSARPTMPPPTKAISDSSTVQRTASSRLRRMSQRVKSTISDAEDEARAEPVQHPPQHDREAEIDQRADDVAFERAEVARLDQVDGLLQLAGGDLAAHGRAEHDDHDLAHERRPDALQRRRQHDAREDLC